MKRSDVKNAILKFLREKPKSQACEIAADVRIHKSTITGYLQELESSSLVFREKEGYRVFWSEKPFTITRGWLLSQPWNKDTMKLLRNLNHEND